MLPGTTLGRLARLNCMLPRASLKRRISTWLRITGLQVRALPGADQILELVCGRLDCFRFSQEKRLLAKVLPLFKRTPSFRFCGSDKTFNKGRFVRLVIRRILQASRFARVDGLPRAERFQAALLTEKASPRRRTAPQTAPPLGVLLLTSEAAPTWPGCRMR